MDPSFHAALTPLFQKATISNTPPSVTKEELILTGIWAVAAGVFFRMQLNENIVVRLKAIQELNQSQENAPNEENKRKIRVIKQEMLASMPKMVLFFLTASLAMAIFNTRLQSYLNI